MKTLTTLTHGVVLSPDPRSPFVRNEGVGSAPGKVDVYDLKAPTKVGTVDAVKATR